jgi:hypothetical protein
MQQNFLLTSGTVMFMVEKCLIKWVLRNRSTVHSYDDADVKGKGQDHRRTGREGSEED